MDAGRLALIVRAGAGYNTIDVAAASVARHLRLELPGQERGRRGRARIRPDPRPRPADPGQRRRPAGRPLEQAGVREGARPVRHDPRAARVRQHRPGAGAPRTGVRLRPRRSGPDGSPTTPTPTSRRSALERTRAGARVAIASIARRGRRAGRHPQRAPGAQSRDARARRGGRPRPPAARRAVHQHRPGRGGRPRGARRCRAGAGDPGGPRRLPERADRRDRRVRGPARRPARGLRDAPHRRVDGAGAGGDRRRGRCGSSTRSAGRAGCRTSSTSPGGRRRPTCSSSATAIGRASSRTCSSTSAQANINVQETENIVFEGAEAAIARINVDRAPSEAELDAIGPGNEDILSVQLVAL